MRSPRPFFLKVRINCVVLCLTGLAGARFAAGAEATTLPSLFEERIKCVVAVDFIIEAEGDRRQPTVVYGTVANDHGVIVLPASAVNGRTPPNQLKDFKVHHPGEAASFKAVYLGQDVVTNWHFIRVEEKMWPSLTPVTKFARPGAPAPAMGQELWGIGLREKSEDVLPFYLESKLSLVMRLPEITAFSLAEVASPGLPVFNREGTFVGLAREGFGQNYVMFSAREHGSPVTLVDPMSSGVLILAEEALVELQRVPKSVSGRPHAWLGSYGLQPVDPEVAKYLNLEEQSGVVVSEVLENSPAEKAGLKERDIVLAIDGKPLPRLKPDRVVVGYFEREIDRRAPGDGMLLSVLRGKDRVEITATLAEQPKLAREADRQYFEPFGFSVREFVFGDGVARRIKFAEHSGVIANFVKPNSPASTAGLRPDDWVREIDGQEVKTYEEAVDRLKTVAADKERIEFVLLVGRNGDTSVLRVKLK